MNLRMGGLSVPAFLLLICPAVSSARTPPTEAKTPGELVSTYESLANGILALQTTEQKLVQSILSSTFTRAQTTLAAVKTKLGAGEPARAEVETLAALVAQLGNEGDAAVASVRKRLLEGGHHHHAASEGQGVYDPGFVIVTRAAKKVFLDAATEIGKLATAPRADSLDAQWSKVERQFDELMKTTGR